MGEEIALENVRISEFHGLLTLTLTSDRVILHTVMHHSSTSTYIPNFIEIEETFCGRTYGHLRPTNVIRSTRRSRPKKAIVDIRLRPKCAFAPLTAYTTLTQVPLMLTELTSLSYVHTSKYICFSTNVHHYHSNNS